MKTELFSIGDHSFTPQHFIEIISYFNLIEEWQGRVGQGNALISSAEKRGEVYDRELISRWSQEFRYEHDLLNVEELNAWLSARALDQQDLEAFLIRRYWLERDTSSNNCDFEKASDKEIFSEIVLSGAYLSLESSWQKRLLAWFENNEAIYSSLDKLEENFRVYEKDLNESCHTDLWLQTVKDDMKFFEIELFEGENQTVELAKPDFTFEGYFKDLPEVIQKTVKYQLETEVEGPFLGEEGKYRWHRIISQKDADLQAADALEYALEKFQAEVWKTLLVKYLD